MIGLSHLIITQIPFQDKEFDFKKMSFLAAQHMTRPTGGAHLGWWAMENYPKKHQRFALVVVDFSFLPHVHNTFSQKKAR